MQKFFRHWHYGIKARVIDGALVADIDTASTPTFVRLDLARLQTVALELASKPGEYELNLVNVGAPGASTRLATFEVKDAAEEAASAIRRALLRGSHKNGFARAFKATMGVMAALLVAALILAASGTLSDMKKLSDQNAALHSLQNLQTAGTPGSPALPGVPAGNGEAVPAEQFLSGVATPATE